MKKIFFDAVTYSALFLFGLFIVYHLGLIWKFGTVPIFESNKMLLAFEIASIAGITLLGLVRLILLYKEGIEKHTKQEKAQ